MASPANQSLSSSTSAASSTIGLSPPRCVGPHCLKIIYHSLHLPSFLPLAFGGGGGAGNGGEGEEVEGRWITPSLLAPLLVVFSSSASFTSSLTLTHSLARSQTRSFLPSFALPHRQTWRAAGQSKWQAAAARADSE